MILDPKPRTRVEKLKAWLGHGSGRSAARVYEISKS